MGKYNWLSALNTLREIKSAIYTPKWEDGRPYHFYTGVPRFKVLILSLFYMQENDLCKVGR